MSAQTFGFLKETCIYASQINFQAYSKSIQRPGVFQKDARNQNTRISITIARSHHLKGIRALVPWNDGRGDDIDGIAEATANDYNKCQEH
jgi:hypothetical protein